MSSRRILVIAAACLLAGCNTANRHIGDEDPFLGEAVKYNAALQTIDPVPVYPAGSAQPGGNGDKGQNATKRYRKDQVKQVETMQTTAGTSGSGGESAPR